MYFSMKKYFILKQFNLLQKPINLIKPSILHIEIRVRIGNDTSQGAQVKTKLKQDA